MAPRPGRAMNALVTHHAGGARAFVFFGAVLARRAGGWVQAEAEPGETSGEHDLADPLSGAG
ncbi:MAG: hypothetical protein HY712_03855 [candidate division NC10 bacterium]|nr:hypothetical protein [candidate division NC10 bacterium]